MNSVIFFLFAFGAAAKNCVQLQVPVHVAATNSKYRTLRIDSTIDAVEWTLDLEYD